ncbi:MAG TPA: NAD-binding protein, partial [Rubrobacter sp.]|nr:NAD-binding protein [Rubrobacter sp.]
YAQMKGMMMVEEDFPTSFSANLARKDAALVLDAAEAHALRMRITESVVARFDEAIQAGHGEEDMAAVYRAARPD